MAATQGEFFNEIVNLFHRFDTDQNQIIGYDECRELLKIIGVEAEHMSKIFDAVDTNKDGMIDWNEFFAWVTSESSPVQEKLVGSGAVAAYALQKIEGILRQQGAPLKDLFAAECLSVPNYLYKQDVFRMMLKYDPTLTESTLEAAFKSFDFDGNQGVDLNEFTTAFNKQTGGAQPPQPPPPPPAAATEAAAAASRVLQYVDSCLKQQGAALEDLFRQECTRTAGYLYKEEVFAMLLKYDGSLTPAVLESAFQIFDWDSNGAVELTEFIRAFAMHAAAQAQAARQEVEVQIPAGYHAGSSFPFDYNGQRYFAAVPANLQPGQVMKVAI